MIIYTVLPIKTLKKYIWKAIIFKWSFHCKFLSLPSEVSPSHNSCGRIGTHDSKAVCVNYRKYIRICTLFPTTLSFYCNRSIVCDPSVPSWLAPESVIPSTTVVTSQPHSQEWKFPRVTWPSFPISESTWPSWINRVLLVTSGTQSLESLTSIIKGTFLAQTAIFLITWILLNVHNNFIAYIIIHLNPPNLYP